VVEHARLAAVNRWAGLNRRSARLAAVCVCVCVYTIQYHSTQAMCDTTVGSMLWYLETSSGLSNGIQSSSHRSQQLSVV